MYGHVSVDDMAVLACHSESIHDCVCYMFIVAQLKIVALLFRMCCLVGYEVAFEGSHLRLVEERAVRSAPQIEKIINCIISFLRSIVVLECRTNHHTDIVEQFLA